MIPQNKLTKNTPLCIYSTLAFGRNEHPIPGTSDLLINHVLLIQYPSKNTPKHITE